jgi:hypothetical protein
MADARLQQKPFIIFLNVYPLKGKSPEEAKVFLEKNKERIKEGGLIEAETNVRLVSIAEDYLQLPVEEDDEGKPKPHHWHVVTNMDELRHHLGIMKELPGCCGAPVVEEHQN